MITITPSRSAGAAGMLRDSLYDETDFEDLVVTAMIDLLVNDAEEVELNKQTGEEDTQGNDKTMMKESVHIPLRIKCHERYAVEEHDHKKQYGCAYCLRGLLPLVPPAGAGTPRHRVNEDD